ncbi:MAG: polysaccharide deacetylase family protein [Nitriliruptorales bacterium]|nr:polysaccharide deacetylase family protein [Nitriliruptorales bacterium]
MTPRVTMRTAAWWALRAPLLRGAAHRAAAVRGNGLVLVYHRIRTAPPSESHEIIPSVTPERFRGHLEALQKAADIVPLERLHSPDGSRSSRPRLAVTFDDDYPSHVEQALPILTQHNVPATFFLSGRTLHDRGPYWFQLLERWVQCAGVGAVAGGLGVDATTATELALACERDVQLQGLVHDREAGDAADVLDREGIRRLADSGMTIGFHTVAHEQLPRLDERALRAALTHGRQELAEAVGSSLRLFAYPHGKADARTAAAVRDCGYAAAWTGHPRPARRDDHAFLRGRWEPGDVPGEELLRGLAVRLHRSAPLATRYP